MSDYTPKFLARFWAKIQKSDDPDGCWLWTASTVHSGHGQIRLNGRLVYVHRISYQIAAGDPGALDVLHSCDNPRCVNPGHLFLGTHQDNMEDRDRKGRQCRGERHPRAKLTDAQVAEIRQRYAEGNVSQEYLGEVYGVSGHQIGRLVHFIDRL